MDKYQFTRPRDGEVLLRRNFSLVVQPDGEVLFTPERECLARTVLRAFRENEGMYGPRVRSRSKVGCLDIIYCNISNSNVLRLELT